MLKKFINYFPLFTIASSPLYLIKLTFLKIPTNIFEVLLCISILLMLFKNKNEVFLYKKNKTIFLAIILIFLGLLMSMFFNEITPASLGIIKSWFFLPILFSLLLVKSFKRNSDLENVLLSLFFSITAVALLSTIQRVLGLITYDNRLQGFYNSPNYLAMFLAPGIFLWFFCFYEIKRDGFYFYKLIMYGSLFLIIISLYLTYSYATWVSILLSLLFILFIKKRDSLKNSTFLLIIITFLLFIFFQSSNDKLLFLLKNNPRSSLESRVMIWNSAEKILQNNVFFGIGSGNFQKNYLAYQKFFNPYLEWAVPHPHNIFLAFWLQAGILGILGFLILIFSLFKILFSNLKKNKTQNFLFFAFFGYFLYFILHGIVDTTYWKNDLAFIFWIFAFLTIYAKENKLL
jgi:O-antigen ligase